MLYIMAQQVAAHLNSLWKIQINELIARQLKLEDTLSDEACKIQRKQKKQLTTSI